MKTKLTFIVAMCFMLVASISCKKEQKNEAEAKEEVKVREAPASALSYAVDNNSLIYWTGKKPTGQHSGTINLKGGDVKTENGKVLNGSFTIDMNSITVTDLEGDEKASLEGHLKGEGEKTEDHFFNVAKFPTATFEITAVTETEEGTTIAGNLTIKGITKNVSFPASISADDNGVTITSDVFTINRTEWGVNYASKSLFDNLGDKFINDDIELKLEIKANPTI